MVKFLGSALLAAGLIVSAGANANTYDLNTLQSGFTLISEVVRPGAFSDTIDFSIGSTSSVGTSIGSTSLAILGISPADITGLNLTVYNSSHTEIGTGTDINLGTLGAGNYYALVKGTAAGGGGGSYTEAFRVSPVPESSTWAMLMAGLGLLGYTVSRRKA